jgi:hypothetical protein
MPKIAKEKINKRRYFTKDVENAILEYNELKDPTRRGVLYEREIHYAFFKLTQNIIHTFKFYNTDVKDLEHLQHEIIVFLLQKIHLYNHSNNLNKKINKICLNEFNEPGYERDIFSKHINNSAKVEVHELHSFIENLNVSNLCKDELYKVNIPKAFSYFGTIVKRYLITYNEKNYQILKNKHGLDYLIKDDSNHVLDGDEVTREDLHKFINKFKDYLDANIESLFKNETNINIAKSIATLFENIEKIEDFKKKNIYIFLREISNEKTHKITKVIKRIKKIYYKKWGEFLETGDFS